MTANIMLKLMSRLITIKHLKDLSNFEFQQCYQYSNCNKYIQENFCSACGKREKTENCCFSTNHTILDQPRSFT